ncbi:Venom carboxylesterase-6 [Orchesella cincta]|uniref:Venom carboxylesterase-6 n=1 Tax=Orchesella cincta TaxID=48709 RepID=A0A1D2N7S1_ORCCI|nr:Venom carboxylesterase-6 [Orchesella cincta]
MRTFPLRVMWKQIAPYFLGYRDIGQSPENYPNLTRMVEEFYFPGKTPRQASLDDFGDMTSDRFLTFGIIRGLQAHANYYPSGTYFYYFSFTDGRHNLANFIGYKGSEWGAGHTEDIFFLFNNTYAYAGHDQKDPDTELAPLIAPKHASSRVPEYRTDEGKLIRIWEPVHNASDIQGMQFDKEVKMIPLPRRYPYPDTSVSEAVVFRDKINVDNDYDLEQNGVGWEDGKNDLYKDTDYNRSHPLVASTSTGKVQGYWMKVVGGRKIRAFEGIPYAEVPNAERRFKAPVPKTPWTGLLKATLKGPKCLQYNQISSLRVVGSENCLYLNIYTPRPQYNKTSTRKYPTVIYIHGGGFLTGSGNDFGPAYLLQRNQILVTINFRLGVLGFMSTMDAASPGNYGLKDQALSIKWVFDNIKAFGGDPGRITLLGHGSGGSSVHFQMVSFKARGKFQAGISISGTAFNQWAMHTRAQALNLTKAFAKSLHCPIHGRTEDTVSCLRRQRGFDLVKMQISFLDTWPLALSLFRPVMEDEYQKEDPFLTETAEEAYARGTVDKVPWICGQAEDEGYTFLLSHVALGTFSNLRQKWNTLAADFLNYNDLPVDQDEITRRVNWWYFRNVNPANAPLKVYSDALGARLIHTGIHKALQAHSQHAETYAFMFGFNGKYNLATAAGIKPKEWVAVGHGEILGYILNSTNMYSGFKNTDSELVLSKILVNIIYNFVDKQIPGFTTETGDDFHLWNPISDPRNMSFLLIDKDIKMIPEPYLKQILYWESLGLPDSLPLGNFSSEIHNASDPNQSGFVSTDITNTGISVPDDLRPPTELKAGNLGQYNYIPENVTTSTRSNIISEPTTIKPPASITTFPSTSITENSNSSESTTLIPITTTNSATTTATFTPLIIPSTPSTPKPPTTARWIAQTHGPIPQFDTPIFKDLETTTTNPVSTSTLRSMRPTMGNIFAGLFGPDRRRNNSSASQNLTRGISIPIISGNYDARFITKSNITQMYLNTLGIDLTARKDTDPHPDEMMITSSNSQLVY